VCWPISRGRNVLETPKLVGRLSTSCAIMRTSFKVKDQRSRSPGRQILKPEVRHIFQTGRPTQTWYTDGERRLASPTRPLRSKVKVARLRDVSDRCWPISRGRNVLETPNVSTVLSNQSVNHYQSFSLFSRQMPDFLPKYTKFNFSWGSAPDPAGVA